MQLPTAKALLVHGWLVVGLSLFAGGAPCIAHSEELSNYTGGELYKRFCASCHGVDADGNGPVAPLLKVMVPDLTRIAKRHGGKFPAEIVQQIVDGRQARSPHGPRDMPIWGWEFQKAGDDAAAKQRADELIGRLVKYLSTVQKN
jgi:mono/diheme cytochrome c family protein